MLILFLITPKTVSAYNLGMDVSLGGYVDYSNPTVLGVENKLKEQKTENRKIQQKIEVKETPRVEKPEKIEIKKDENMTRVTFKKQEKVVQEMKPENVNLKFDAVPKTTPVHIPEAVSVGESNVDNTNDVLIERGNRINEKVQIQSEIHDDGTSEIQIESRMVKAKVKNSEIELDLKKNNVGELVHLPDQAMQKFLDLGVSVATESMEIGQSGNKFEYSVNTVKEQKLFGLIPRQAKFKMILDDNTGNIEQKAVANNIIEQLLNMFSF